MGIWKSSGIYYNINNRPLYYNEGDFDIYNITPGNLELVQRVHSGDDMVLRKADYDYAIGDFNDYNLEVKNLYNDEDIRTIFFIDNSGRMLLIGYKMNQDGEPYFLYEFLERFDGTLDECIDSFN